MGRPKKKSAQERAINVSGKGVQMLVKKGVCPKEALAALIREHKRTWKMKYLDTSNARKITLKELTWANYYRQNHEKRAGGSYEVIKGDAPRLRFVRDVEHQLQKLGLLSGKELCPVPVDRPSSVLDSAIYDTLKKAHELKKRSGKGSIHCRSLLTTLLEKLNGPPPTYSMAGLARPDRDKILSANEQLFEWIGKDFMRTANEESKALGLQCAVQQMDMSVGTPTSEDQNRYWRNFSIKVEEQRRKDKLQEAMSEVRALAGDAFVDNFSLTLNGGTVNILHNQVEGNADAPALSLEERKDLTKFYFDACEQVGGLALVPALNASPHLFQTLRPEVSKITTESIARAQAEKLRDDLLGVRSEVPTGSSNGFALPTFCFGCPWCKKDDIENESALKVHFSDAGSLDCKTKLDELVAHPALKKKASERSSDERLLFKETLKTNAVEGVKRYRQGLSSGETIFFPPGPVWPSWLKKTFKIYYSLEQANEAYEKRDLSLLHKNLTNYHYKKKNQRQQDQQKSGHDQASN